MSEQIGFSGQISDLMNAFPAEPCPIKKNYFPKFCTFG